MRVGQALCIGDYRERQAELMRRLTRESVPRSGWDCCIGRRRRSGMLKRMRCIWRCCVDGMRVWQACVESGSDGNGEFGEGR